MPANRHTCHMHATITRERRQTIVDGKPVEIDDEFYRCRLCGREFYTPALTARWREQVDAALQR